MKSESMLGARIDEFTRVTSKLVSAGALVVESNCALLKNSTPLVV